MRDRCDEQGQGDFRRRGPARQGFAVGGQPAFSPGASVSEDTRAKVLKAARKLGYRPNAIARAMISGHSRLIAVLVAYLDNQFYPIVHRAACRGRCRSSGFHVLLFMTDPGNQDRVVQQMLGYQVEGIVMASATLSSTLGARMRPDRHSGRVVQQVCAIVARQQRHLRQHRRRAAGCPLPGGGRPPPHRLHCRKRGLLDQPRPRGRLLPGPRRSGHDRAGRRAVGNYTFDGAAEAARQLCKAKSRPDAIFVANDHMAFSVMDVLRNELKLRVPDRCLHRRL